MIIFLKSKKDLIENWDFSRGNSLEIAVIRDGVSQQNIYIAFINEPFAISKIPGNSTLSNITILRFKINLSGFFNILATKKDFFSDFMELLNIYKSKKYFIHNFYAYYFKNNMPIKITHRGNFENCKICKNIIKFHGLFNLNNLLVNKKGGIYRLIRPNKQPAFSLREFNSSPKMKVVKLNESEICENSFKNK